MATKEALEEARAMVYDSSKDTIGLVFVRIVDDMVEGIEAKIAEAKEALVEALKEHNA